METQALAAVPSGGMLEVAKSRAAQEIQAAMMIAKKMPRNETQAMTRIMESCKRKTLAEKAVYVFPRGNQTVSGPSIRLAEAIAKAWGNLDCGIVELERTPGVGSQPGESNMMAYAWDLETNTRMTKIFTVKHKRDTKRGSYNVDDERDVYELTANQGSRRLRSCILGVVPGDVVEQALDACNKTLAGGGEGPLIDRIRKMAGMFLENFQVSVPMIEKRLGHKIDVTTEAELIQLGHVYRTLDDQMATRDQYFEIGDNQTAQAVDLNARVGAAPVAPQPAPAPAQAATAAPTTTQPAPAAPSSATKQEKPKAAKAATKAAAPAPAAPQAVSPAQSAAPAVQESREPGSDDEGVSFEQLQGSSIQQEQKPGPTPPPLPKAAQPAPEANPAEPYRFPFGREVKGKTMVEAFPSLKAAKEYLSRLESAPSKDAMINTAIEKVQEFVASLSPAPAQPAPHADL